MHPFALAFLVALLAHLATQWWLARRQIAHVAAHRSAIPAGFEGAVSQDEHAKAADYACARQRLGVIESLYDTAVVLAMTLGGGISMLGLWASGLVPPGVPAGTLQLLGVFAVLALLGLPFTLYRTFVLEQRFGFNRTRPATFIADQLKGWALGAVLGGAVAATVLWIMARAGTAWWLVAWLAWAPAAHRRPARPL